MHRYRTWARKHAHGRSHYSDQHASGNILPSHPRPAYPNTEAGGLNEKQGGHGSAGCAPQPGGIDGSAGVDGVAAGAAAGGGHGGGAETAAGDDAAEDAISRDASAAAPPPHKSEDASAGSTTVASAEDEDQDTDKKLPLGQRFTAGFSRFFVALKDAIFHSWVNVLLVFVPIGIIAEAIKLSPGIVFGMNAIAIIPLAGLLAFATEAVAAKLGDTLGALLNVSFGNAVELIIFIIALVKNEIEIVQASLLGSILANLLLILGMSFLFGGLLYREQIYNSTVTQMSACLLSLSVTSLLLPTAFYASFKQISADLADKQVLKVSRGVSVVLLIVYVLYLLFQLKTHAYMYESIPQERIDEESHPGVLADMMNSSSSSDDSSSSSDSSDSDSDSSASGSVAAAGKRIKRAFKSRRRRKYSASTSSVTHSALSSPSTLERQNSYWESGIGSQHASRRPSQLLGLNDADVDADNEDNSVNRPRVKDFGETSSKSPERKKHRKRKHSKKFAKKRQRLENKKDAPEDLNAVAVPADATVQPPSGQAPKTVGFTENTEIVEAGPTPGGTSFNMRPFSARVRPGLPKLLSNNVFVTPPPAPMPQQRPLPPIRSHSNGANLRRSSSLPDRLNRHESNTPSRLPVTSRTDPLPPFQHQRFQRARQAVENVKEKALEASSDTSGDSKKPDMSRTSAIVLLLCTTALVAVCAEFMVDAIPRMIADNPGISEAFVGLIILPIVGNAAEHVTAVTVAMKNKMDLAIAVAVGSSIQIALFVTPIVVLLGWILQSGMSLYFNLFETISLFVTAFVVNFLVLDGRTNYLEGSLLIAAYVIVALGAFFYPAAKDQSLAGGGA